MDIKTMHAGIDLGLQRINSNVFGNLERQAKDYYINTTTQEFIKLALTNEVNTIFNAATYADIRTYDNKLQGYIKTVELGKTEKLGFGYAYGVLPQGIPLTAVTTGVLYQGVKYKVVVAGTTDLTLFGYKTVPVVGETFECDITEQTGASIAVVSGEEYQIINAHGGDFTAVGAPDSNPGTVFTATSTAAVSGGVSTVVQNLSDTPAWAASTQLIPVGDTKYFLNLASRTSTKYGQVITSGTLTVGKKYIVTVTGTTDFSSVGGVATPDVNYIFTCNSSASITWQGATEIYEIIDNINRLVKMQDVYNFLHNTFGATIEEPISTLADDKLNVYHDNKFTVERLFLDYIRTPIEVSYTNLVDSDLPESVQGFLIELVVKKIAAFNGQPNYTTINSEVKDTE